MKYKKIMIILALFIFIFSAANVVAADVDDNAIASDDTKQIALSASDMDADNLQSSEENTALTQTKNDESSGNGIDSQALGADAGNYSGLVKEIGSGGNIELTHDYYSYDSGSTIVISVPNTVIDGKGAVIDMAESKNMRVFLVNVADVTIKNLTIKNANYDGVDGSAIYAYNGLTVLDCTFINNTCTGGTGTIRFLTGNIVNSNFINNSAKFAGAIKVAGNGAVARCNFTNNSAFKKGYSSGSGGAVLFSMHGDLRDCNFVGNTAVYHGGAVCFENDGIVLNCNFTNNRLTAPDDSYGGAVAFIKLTDSVGVVSDCNFVNNSASDDGGAVSFSCHCKVNNCNFTNNSLTADDSLGGAVYVWYNAEFADCNFIGNNASEGSAIYLNAHSGIKRISNSCFLNNKAKVQDLEVIKNDNNITIVLTGNDNFINAIYAWNPITFTNVTYWGAYGIETISSTISKSDREAGQNISVAVVSDNIVLDKVYVTDENGEIVLDISAGDNYFIAARHDDDSYYTGIEKIISQNVAFNVNVTSQTTNNRTVNITAKSNIPNNFVKGKLVFILPDGTQINANYGDNGTWWAENKFDDYGIYQVNASYEGLDNVTVNDATINITKVDSTITLDNVTLDYGDSTDLEVTTEGATGITAKINGSDVACDNFVIPISGLAAGNYILTVTTIPDEDHNPVTATSKITVNKVESTLTVDDVELDYGESKNVTVTAEGATGIVAKIDGADVACDNFVIQISDLSAGTHTLTVTAVPDDNHTEVSKTATITVNKVDSTLTVDDVELDYGESKDVTVSAEGVTGIVAKIDGADVACDNFVIQISDLSAGTHTLTVTAVPDENHTAVTKTATITVGKVSTKVTAAAVTATYKVNKYLVIKLTDGQGNPLSNATVTVDLNGAKNYTTDENGQVKVKVSNMVPKSYTAKISYAGNDTYTGSNATAKVVVKKATPKITASAKTFKTLTKTKKYAIILKDNTGKAIKNAKVTLKVNGKTFKATTNSKGKATFKITKLTKKGTYKATITYTGNKYYNKVTKKANIKVVPYWKTVQKGSKDKATVKEIQRALKNHGYYLSYNGHYLMVDGIYWIYTEMAVKQFQNAKIIKVTGKVDEETAIKLGLIKF
ncbi:MAG: hypothetical protein E7Z83_04645 [Methanobrevibacter sp.]|nr:peptidoglycan-binding protein [Methanobrevibacter sp.]MBE6490127.1 hypothetical protein [Methanobrevibacter sp.]